MKFGKATQASRLCGTRTHAQNTGVSPNPVRISSGFENGWGFDGRASVLECGSPLFALPTSPKPSRETKAALIICHPELAKDLTPRQPALCNHLPFSKLTAPHNGSSVPITCRLKRSSESPREIPSTDSGQALRRLRMNLPVADRRSTPTARPQCSLVSCNTRTFALQEWRWSRVGLPISATASWSAGSPLPLSQAGESPAYGSFPLPSEHSASLRQRMLRLELTPDVARRTAKAVEDYPHSKTLTRPPSPSRFFELCHHLAIRTGHCYSLLGQRPTGIYLTGGRAESALFWGAHASRVLALASRQSVPKLHLGREPLPSPPRP